MHFPPPTAVKHGVEMLHASHTVGCFSRWGCNNFSETSVLKSVTPAKFKDWQGKGHTEFKYIVSSQTEWFPFNHMNLNWSMNLHSYTHMQIHTYTHVHTNPLINTHILTYTHTHTNAHTHTHTHTHTRTKHNRADSVIEEEEGRTEGVTVGSTLCPHGQQLKAKFSIS